MDIMAAAIGINAAKDQTRPFGFEDAGDRDFYIPKFKKLEGAPIFTAKDAKKYSIYWPKIVEAHRIFKNPLGRYYMYFSTNHDSAGGGIGLAYADDWKGPYKFHGIVYTDTVAGNQTETPRTIWNEDTQELHLYYHNSGVGVGQSTLLALSKDGINFTRFGLILDRPDGYPGDGHTGYFAPFRIGTAWYGYSLMGGGDYGRKALSHSIDGKFWYTDPRPLMGGNDATRNVDVSFSRPNSGVIHWRGHNWWVGMKSTYASGGAPAEAVPAMARISNNLRQLLDKPHDIVAMPSLPWETSNIQSMSVTVIDGTIVIAYNVDDKIGIIYSDMGGES